ncbi:hypothetical protein [Phytomonospora endophytica]|uniref:Putative membrane protein YgcG n=1 Tax=Phytomonospora endophytica TaxID=714109 RepID=A0A841G248_9ACTN|nr:hypothetical protein [Phytomonospora endophytica]MBB6039842.1 putative membrane protein YgcG [Phytomonospora endophytica]GIG70304.1 hypothetical protein Pen01_65990 [Phytomonospora endophytica]
MDFPSLRDLVVEPLEGVAQAARKMATELERFSSETDRERVALTGAWSGADASAAGTSLSGNATSYKGAGAQYSAIDEIITTLVSQLTWAKRALESAIDVAPQIPGSVNGTGTVSVNWAALGSNPSGAAIAAAKARAQQVAGYIMQALQHASQADQQAQAQLARITDVPVPTARPDVSEDVPVPEERPTTGLNEGKPADVTTEKPADGASSGGGSGGRPNGSGSGNDSGTGTGSGSGGGQSPGGGGQGGGEGDGQGDGTTPPPVVQPGEDGKIPPVAGLTEQQMENARTIIEVGKRLGISEQGQEIALATAMQESNLRNLANSTMPDSLNLPNEGTGKDHDSVGLFQQRPSAGWGTVAECMNTEYAAEAFYQGLERVDGWENMELTEAAQSVQRSAFPDAYAKWEDEAEAVLDSYRASR